MSITSEQLEQIKAANHSKSLAWEAATFVPGDKVVSFSRKIIPGASNCYTVRRSDEGNWIDYEFDTTYDTLSRWLRTTLKVKSYNVNRGAMLVVKDSMHFRVGRLPPSNKRTDFHPWTLGNPTLPYDRYEDAKAVEEAKPKSVDDEKEKFKVANHAATLAWEAATFNVGDEVCTHGHKAIRSASGTWSYKGQSYETLSRWARALLNVKFADVKRNVFVIKDNKRIPVGQLNAHRKEDANMSERITDLRLIITSSFEVIAKRLDAIEARLSRLAESATVQTVQGRAELALHAEPQSESAPLSESMIGSAFVGKHDDKCTGCIQCNDEMYRNYQNQKAEEEEEAERIRAYNEYHGLN